MRLRFPKPRQIFSQDVLDRLVDRALEIHENSVIARNEMTKQSKGLSYGTRLPRYARNDRWDTPHPIKSNERTIEHAISQLNQGTTPTPHIFDERKGCGESTNNIKGLA